LIFCEPLRCLTAWFDSSTRHSARVLPLEQKRLC